MLDQYLRRIGWAMIGLGVVLFVALPSTGFMDYLLATFPPPVAGLLLVLVVADAAVLPGLVFLVLGSIYRDTRELLDKIAPER